MSNRAIQTNELANPELAPVEVHGITRSSFILRGALAAGAFYGTTGLAPTLSANIAAGYERGDGYIKNLVNGKNADEFFHAFRGGSYQQQHAFPSLFHPGLQVDPVGPHVHVSSR